MTPQQCPRRTARPRLLGALGLGLGFSLACTAQYKTIDEQVICDEVGFAISARVHACTGDEARALAHHDAFNTGFSCKQGWFDDWDETEDAYSCATTMGAVSCADAAELGTDIAAWLALDEDCADILQEGRAGGGPGGGDAGAGTGGAGTGGEGTGGEATGGECTGGEGTGGEGTGGEGTGGDDTPSISGTLYAAGSTVPISGTSICIWDTDLSDFTDCTTTGTDGTYTFDPAPQDELRALYISGGNTLAHFVDLDLGAGPHAGVDLWAFGVTALNAAASSVGQTPQSGRTFIAFHAVDEAGQPLGGVTVTLTPTPADGAVTFLAPDTGAFEPTHTQTTSMGSGIWVNATRGEYTVNATHGARSCVPVEPLAADGAGGALVRATDGYVFAANFVCTP